jgi:hypothetical protein
MASNHAPHTQFSVMNCVGIFGARVMCNLDVQKTYKDELKHHHLWKEALD